MSGKRHPCTHCSHILHTLHTSCVSHTPYTPACVRRVRTQACRGYGSWLQVNEVRPAAAHTAPIDLHRWHHAIHQVTGDMALRFNKASADDLERWARMLRDIADEMEAAE